MNAETLLLHYERIADVPDAVDRLRRFILDLAIRGKLVEQDPQNLTASDALVAARRLLEEKAGQTARLRWKPSRPVLPNEIRSQVPPGWVAARVNDTGLYINGMPFKPSDWKTSGIPIIRIQNLTDPNKGFNYTTGNFPDEVMVRPGDLLVSWSATLDAFVWQRGNGVLNQHIFRVIAADGLTEPRFLHLLLQRAIREMAASEHAHGLAMMHINRGPFMAHVVLVPPLAEQRRIVAKFDELMVLCDQLEAARLKREAGRDRLTAASLARLNTPDPETFQADARFALDALPALTTRPDQNKALRQTILNLAVRGKLVPQDATDEPASELLMRIAMEKARLVKAGAIPAKKRAIRDQTRLTDELPTSWLPIALGDICSLVTSGSRGWAEFYADKGPGFIRAQNIRFGRLRLDGLAFVNPPSKSEGSRTQVAKGDLLVVITGAGVTNPAHLDHDLGEAYVSQHVGLVRPTEGELSKWLLLCLMADAGGRAELVERAYGAGKPGLNLDNIRSLSIPLPPLAEQHRIVAKVEELMALCDRLEARLVTAGTTRQHLLNALLHPALHGSTAAELDDLEAVA